jgi:hypothetical protein
MLMRHAKLSASKQLSFGLKLSADEVHTDPYLEHMCYVTFTDDHTRHTLLDHLRRKDEAFETYKTCAVWAKTQYRVCMHGIKRHLGLTAVENTPAVTSQLF